MWDEVKFDEELQSWEDYLWFFLLQSKYVFQYCPKAGVYHTHPFSIKAISDRAYRDGKSFKVIKEKYDIDIIYEMSPTLQSKIGDVFRDLKTHVKFFMQQKYTRYLPLIPLVRLAVYKAYWKGYRAGR
jgi:hypothetical protein